MRRVFDEWLAPFRQRGAYMFWLAVSLAVALVGPFGTYAAMDLPGRFVLWGATVAIVLLAASLFSVLIRRVPRLRDSWLSGLAIGALLAILLSLPFSRMVQAFVPQEPPVHSATEIGAALFFSTMAAAAFSQITTAGNKVTAGGGAKLSHVISTAVREGLAGLEALAGIPGTVGGALHDNADANGTDIGQWTTKATMLTRTGAIVEQRSDQLQFAYRSSSLDELAILSAEFTLEKGDPETLTKRMQKFWIVKQSNQPAANENPACVFKDVGGMNASSLIEQAGCKGASVGHAIVSQRDSRFIVANPGTTSEDVMQLIEKIQSAVQEQLGVELETQVQIW